jgi:hypothetical protein
MDERTRELGETLLNRLINHLAEAHKAAVPPGTLGAGMQISCGTSDERIGSDNAGDALRVEARVWVEVRRNDTEPAT